MSFEQGAELLNFGAFIAFIGVNAAALLHYKYRSQEKSPSPSSPLSAASSSAPSSGSTSISTPSSSAPRGSSSASSSTSSCGRQPIVLPPTYQFRAFLY
jgi:hypothetical protein